VTLTPLIAGGAQERRRRGGTEPVAVLSGFGAAAAAAARDLDGEARRLAELRVRIERALVGLAPETRIHGGSVLRLSNTISAAVPGIPGETLVIALDLAGIAVSTGSACASGAVLPSHVIRAMGFSDEEARGAVRVSLGWSTTEHDVDLLLAALPPLIARATMAHR
jgi:cysteine desulfurase